MYLKTLWASLLKKGPARIEPKRIAAIFIVFVFILTFSGLKIYNTKRLPKVLLSDPFSLTIDCNLGRLGNQMFTYATLYGVARFNRRTAYAPSCSTGVLQKYFNLSLASFDSNHLDDSRVHIVSVDNFTVPPKEHVFNVKGKYPVSYRYFVNVREEIFNEFRFLPFVAEYADRVLRAVRKNCSQCALVGVHVRRDDFHDHLCRMKGQNEVSPSFYNKAMDIFRKKLSNSAFVVTSDDPKWARENLHGNDVFYVGNKALDPVFDLAVLARCNHTIFAYGTFGFWAAYLSGGQVIYLADLKKSNPQLDSTLKDEDVYLPGWIGINGSEPLKCS